jgi:uncharacterized membrane protein
MYLLLALAASVAYGAADFFGGVAARRSSLVPVIFISQGLALVLVAMLAPLLGGVPNAPAFFWGATAGVAYAACLILLYGSLAKGQMSVVAPITGVCGLASPVIVGLLLGERPGAGALVGIVLSAGAIVLISRDASSDHGATASQPPEGKGSARRYVLMAIGAGVALGFFFITLAQTTPEAGLWPLVAARSVTTGCYFAVALFTKQSLRIPAQARHTALIGGALDICANSLYLLSVRGGLLSLAATVTSLYPATTVLLAALVLKEKIGRTQAFGLVCAMLAVLLITAA